MYCRIAPVAMRELFFLIKNKTFSGLLKRRGLEFRYVLAALGVRVRRGNVGSGCWCIYDRVVGATTEPWVRRLSRECDCAVHANLPRIRPGRQCDCARNAKLSRVRVHPRGGPELRSVFGEVPQFFVRASFFPRNSTVRPRDR